MVIVVGLAHHGRVHPRGLNFVNIVYVVEGLICLFLGAINDGAFEVAVANLIFESETVHFYNAGQGLVRRDIRKESTLLL